MNISSISKSYNKLDNIGKSLVFIILFLLTISICKLIFKNNNFLDNYTEGFENNDYDNQNMYDKFYTSIYDFIAFDDDTPRRLLQKIQPDILVKGGDYSPKEVVGYEIVEAYNGEVHVLGYFDECSTTGIVEKIQAK